MAHHSMQTEDETWSVIDEETQIVANLDGVELSGMPRHEASQMLKILDAIDSIRRSAICASHELAKSRKPRTRPRG
ncbi:hypothetical protein [Rhizobium sp. WYJ-E13]|uniref:hypothetical protein n=1 Tax=Rhizobium sp. WYJ-E13 TaxID=2849093 RepID=UPI001C1E92C4|nr:hypothetical protein [Rhizobium sp. WYJ-E13]QWW70607.1 hypothetical protein KQ933_27740 [Rhizobium sp. WYJ-E13]